MSKDLSDIKLKQNSGIILPLPEINSSKLNILIFGNTIGFFGYARNNSFISNKGYDLERLKWLIKAIQNKVNVTIIGEIEEHQYYNELRNTIKNKYNLTLKINKDTSYITKVPKDYLKVLDKLKNMNFDYIIGNPPFQGGNNKNPLHLKCVDKVYDLFTKRMLIIMPYSFVNKGRSLIDKYFNKFYKNISYAKEIPGDVFEGTSMGSVAIYEFNKNFNQNNCLIIEDINGNKFTKKENDNNYFSDYEKFIVQYLKSNNIYAFNLKTSIPKDNSEKLIIEDKTKIFERVIKKYKNKYFLSVNIANGALNGKYINNNTGKIFYYNDINILNDWINRNVGAIKYLYFNSELEANNCKIALQNPLLRFALYKIQDDQSMNNRCYAYVPNIDWEDPRCTTDEGLLEMCGCPKDKAKEYAEYVKNYVENRDKEFENRKKRK